MSKIVFVLPVIRPPKCKDCKWSVKFKDTFICTTFKVNIDSKMYNENETYLLDTEIARISDQFCGYYGTQFELKD
jgi:hypothetical protein